MKLLATSVLVSLATASGAMATTVVRTLDASPTTAGVWANGFNTGSGTVGTVDLTGTGGDLEGNQPLPVGALQFTTTFDNNDRANAVVQDDYGAPGDVFSTLQISFDYHKAFVAGGNAFAAPSLKLAFFNGGPLDPSSAGDGYGQLIYEPTWNQPGNEGSSVAVPTDTWTSVSIDGDSGLFWWTGGFGQPNTAGGPPLRTLNEWLSAFNSNSLDFSSSTLFEVGFGVGSFNQGQLGYVDNVSIRHDGYSASYDFEPVPTPTAALAGLVGLGLVALRRRA
ncbi:hypothetical protein [Mucisphaera sp.]|uniref:hypothetical protein n=1 Tax=Mucisphaera sp. TaxID=2913024 RepID=UPI003D0A0CA8